MLKICKFITRFMSVIVIAAAVLAYVFPQISSIVKTSYIAPLLGCIMLGMGMTLNPSDIVNVFKRPKDLAIGVVSQFVIMPALAYFLIRLFCLPPEIALGVILVGCCPGGTSSNVITYLSKGDIALSVGITGCTTLMAPVMTPLLVKLYAGEIIPVDFWAMFLSIVEVIIAPIAAGLLFKRFLPKVSNAIVPYLPAFSTLIITLIVIAVVSANAVSLAQCGVLIFAVVILHNLLGYALGLGAARLFGLSMPKATALSIEVGMQNSGLACSLAAIHFQALSMATVPGAVFSVWHNISGALLSRVYLLVNERVV